MRLWFYVKNNGKAQTHKMSQTEKTKRPVIVAQIMGKWIGGGVESVIMNYYRHLDHTKIQFDFICDEDSTRIPYDEIKKLGGRVFLVPKYQKLPKYLKALEELFRKNHYRIVHSNVNTLSVFPLYAAKKAGVPVRISHSHSTSNAREWKRNIIKNILRPFSKRYATDYFACSELAGRYLFGDKTFDRGEVKIIHNAIDLDKFKFDPVARKKLRKELGIDDETIVIGHVGRFVQTKNHHFLVYTFKKYHNKNPNTKLLLIGTGPLEEKIRAQVKKLNLEDSVLFLGQRNDTNKLYSVMDIFCLPSLYEGLPVAGIEAQAAGLPCVYSDKVTIEADAANNAYYASIKNIYSYLQTLEQAIANRVKNRNNIKFSKYFQIGSNINVLEKFYQKPLRVMHLISTDVFSGAENVACQIINLFKDNQECIMTYCTVIGKNEEALKCRGINTTELDRFNLKSIKKAYSSFKPNIIQAHDPKATIAAVLTNKKQNIISHIHSNHRYMRKITLKSLIYHFYIEKHITGIIWVSNSAKDEYIFAKNIPKTLPSYVIQNVVNGNQLKSIAKTDKNNYNFDIIFLGRLEDVKDPLRFVKLIEKIKQHQEIKVAMVGDGSLRSQVEEEIDKLSLNKNIVLFGNQVNPYKILLNSKILVITSKYEGMPMNALEAIACNIPVVSTPVDGLLDIIDRKYLCKTDQDFAEIILKILNREEVRKHYKNKLFALDKKLNNTVNFSNSISRLYN